MKEDTTFKKSFIIIRELFYFDVFLSIGLEQKLVAFLF